MKAMDPQAVRPVKVKTLGMTEEEVQKTMLANTLKGTPPQWEEIPEADTAELDTETLFANPSGRVLHQTTVPIPTDAFPKLSKTMSATQMYEYAFMMCLKNDWPTNFPNLIAALNNLDMDID